jgi:hypothetical protein
MHIIAVLLAAVALSTPAHATDSACVDLVRLNSARLEGSALLELQMQLHAYQFTKMFLDPISANPKFGPGWREGNPFWEEAYALLHPEILAHLRAAGARELRAQEAKLPGKLQAKTCREHLALLRTPRGEVAARIDQATESRKFLADLEKQFPIPARLAPFVQRTRDEIAAGVALEDSPEVKQQEALHRNTREQLRAYDKRVLAAARTLGDTRGPKDQEASRKFGQDLTKRHEQELVSIFRRFATANASAK